MYANFVPTLFFSDLDTPRYTISHLCYGDDFLSKKKIFLTPQIISGFGTFVSVTQRQKEQNFSTVIRSSSFGIFGAKFRSGKKFWILKKNLASSYTPRSLAWSDSTRRIWPHTVRQHLNRSHQCVYLHLFPMCYIWPCAVLRPCQTTTAWRTVLVCTGLNTFGIREIALSTFGSPNNRHLSRH